jgi:uncharacterized protein YbaR (Trm112 family)
MAIDLAPELLDILACPNCHGSLAVDHDRDELVCLAADCGLAYPVRQGIPVLLIDEARRPGPDLPSGSAASAASAADPSTSASAADPSTSSSAAGSGTSSSAAGPGTAASAPGMPGSSSSAAGAGSNGSAGGPATGASATDAERS